MWLYPTLSPMTLVIALLSVICFSCKSAISATDISSWSLSSSTPSVKSSARLFSIWRARASLRNFKCWTWLSAIRIALLFFSSCENQGKIVKIKETFCISASFRPHKLKLWKQTLWLTNRFYLASCVYSDNARMTPNVIKTKKATSRRRVVWLIIIPRFDLLRALSGYTHTRTNGIYLIYLLFCFLFSSSFGL